MPDSDSSVLKKIHSSSNSFGPVQCSYQYSLSMKWNMVSVLLSTKENESYLHVERGFNSEKIRLLFLFTLCFLSKLNAFNCGQRFLTFAISFCVDEILKRKENISSTVIPFFLDLKRPCNS